MGKNGDIVAIRGRIDDPIHRRAAASIDQAVHQEQAHTRQQQLARSHQQDAQHALRMSV
ncbi:hypothetical protein XGA_0295 [Xanthomonas hortorum ATCC 19865]|nr:hypothetical protein XGA_0295 [Xanthomonas hortorum ATCC 19865]